MPIGACTRSAVPMPIASPTAGVSHSRTPLQSSLESGRHLIIWAPQELKLRAMQLPAAPSAGSSSADQLRRKTALSPPSSVRRAKASSSSTSRPWSASSQTSSSASAAFSSGKRKPATAQLLPETPLSSATDDAKEASNAARVARGALERRELWQAAGLLQAASEPLISLISAPTVDFRGKGSSLSLDLSSRTRSGRPLLGFRSAMSTATRSK
mmetsp:Transcript_107609/g.304375  ORF Transcript_107609/g.304375 Transcript_107609/m.304375 type:complete len:213 (-) Transcript_107609:182-820(-)